MNTRHGFRSFVAALCGGALMLGAAAPAMAALFDDTEARQRIELTNQRLEQTRRQLEERVSGLETQLRNQGLVDIFNQIEQLKREVAQLRGQLEVISYELAEAQKRQRDLYVDLDSRMRRLESAPAAQPSTSSPPPAAAAPVTPSAEPSFGPPSSSATASGPNLAAGPGTAARPGEAAPEQRAYDSALDLFKAGSYGAAIQSFAAFVRNYPRSPLAPSAQYWIGNAQFALRDFRGAINSQRQLLSMYPDSSKAPDAMLNIASSQLELGDTTASRRMLEDLVARYPQSEAATKARQRLAGR